MEMYLYILAGFLVGVLCANLFRRSRKASKAASKALRQELVNARKEITRITESAEKLQSELQQAQQRLKENEENVLSNADDQTKVLIRQKDDAHKVAVKTLSDQIEAQQKELKSLKRKVEDLENDVEDAEDDKKSVEKKLKAQKEEFDKLFGDMQHAQLELQRLKGVEEKYTDSEALSEKRKKAIEFVSYILSAPVANRSERSSRQLNLVDQVAAFIKDDFTLLMRENNWSVNQNREDLERFVANQKKTWIKDKTAVAFIGEFSSGKTSIVNRILKAGNPNATLLPTSSKATTAIPTYISSVGNNTRPQYTFIAKDESRKALEDKIVEEMSKETLDEVRGMDQLINYVVREEANASLNGFSILDTPGFSSNDAKDKERTLEVVNECDALFWVVDVNSGTINQTSLAVIKKELKKPLYIVVNKVDSKATSEVDKVVRKIEETLRNKGVPYQGIIRFSMKEDIKQIMNVIHAVTRNKPVDNYIKNSQYALKELEGAMWKKYEETQDCIKNSRLEIDSDEDAIDDIVRQIRDYGMRLINMPQPKSTWLGLGANQYVITEKQAEDYVRLIEEIAIDLTNRLIDKIKSLEGHASEHGASSKALSEIAGRGTKITESKEYFEKLVRDLNR
ncbi:hypothetical protein BHU09_03335 [Tannerella sp. oral taxon 808]|nr:hypothetical protein BHU09_03335 [Tannerella sp. oral taxon 808]